MAHHTYPSDFVCPHCLTNDWATTEDFLPVQPLPPLWRKLALPFLLVLAAYLLLILVIGWHFGVFHD